MVASTPRRENADRYGRIKQILISGKVHELCAYETAPRSTCKEIIRGIPLQDNPATIDGKIVNQNNPLALATKRIAQTGTVIIAFDGHRVPNFVRYGTLLMKCSLYRKQVDVCHACGRLRHRADVCPTPSDVVCRGCGLPNPDDVPDSKSSSQRRELFDPPIRKPHPAPALGAADARAREADPQADGSRPTSPSPARSSSRGRSKSRTGSDSSNRPRYKTPTGGKGKSSLTWADRARGNQTQASNSQDSHDPRLTNEFEELKRANAAEMAEIRRLALTPPAPQPAAMDAAEASPKTVAVKRRALHDSRGDETVKLLSELKNVISNIQAGLSRTRNDRAPPAGPGRPQR
ncbi:hypothetical protein HPB49_006309 [Dermacentor silvarum]|uniref:Uncharacterized protein n=1 Tax=Dermacentor silvarum TaxID=543639 RepID=A0ACB8CVK7_DERSI|nr:hypothetical protein HPB49_006309 [Dermacentor silvarum]